MHAVAKIFLMVALWPAVCLSQASATVTGVVSSGNNGQTIPGALVKSGTVAALSDATGSYTLVLTSGVQVIECRAAGYSSQQRTVVVEPRTTSEVHIKLAEDLNPLEEIVVSAERYEQKLGEVTASMEVIKPALVQNKNSTSFEQVMNQVPGLQVNDGQASIRGGSGFSYGAGSRVLMLVDEIPLISADAGDVKWNYLPLENLEQVEVIKGASSVLYGSGALNGVINFRTAFARRDPRTSVTLFHGRYDAPRNTYKWWKGSTQAQNGLTLSHSQKIGRLDLVLGAHKFSDDGFRMLETESRDRFNASLRFSPKKLPELNMGVNTNMMQVKGGLFFLWHNYDSAYVPRDFNIQNYRNGRFNIDPWVSWNGGNDTSGSYRVSLRNRYFKTHNSNDKNQDSYSELFYSELQFVKSFFSGLRLTAGFVQMQQSVLSDSIYGRHMGRNLAGYIQGSVRLFDRLTLTAGVRGERFRLDSAQSKAVLRVPGKNLDLGFQPVMRAGVNYRAARYTYLRASFGQGYRFPSVAEKYVSTNVAVLNILPNPGLRPERSYNAEVSIRQGFSVGGFRASADLAGFYTRYSDMIEFVFDVYRPGGATGSLDDLAWAGFQSQNVGEGEISGAELSLNGSGYIGAVKFTLLAGYTRINPVQPGYDPITDTLGLQGVATLKYRSREIGKGDIQADYRRFSAGYSFRYQSRIENIDRRFVQSLLHEYSNPFVNFDNMASTFVLPGLKENFDAFSKAVVVQDVRLSCWVTKVVRLSFIVNNLANVEYQARPGDMRAPTQYLGQVLIRLQ